MPKTSTPPDELPTANGAWDGKAFGQEVVALVKSYVERETKALRDDVKKLRRQVEALRK